MFCYINSETRYNVYITCSNLFIFTFIISFIIIINNIDRNMINITYNYIITNRIKSNIKIYYKLVN